MTYDNAMITPFPQTPVTENENQRAVAAAAATTTATPWARARAHARNEETGESAAYAAFMRLTEYYCESFGRRSCPPSIQRQMVDALKAGMKAKVICLCIDAAQEAERPTWAYAHAVMDRCIKDGALTPQLFYQRSARQRGNKYGSSAGEYPRREELDAFTPDIFDDV